MKKAGGVRPWLSIHITLGLGLIAVLVHAGFPYHFNSDELVKHGLAGLTVSAHRLRSKRGLWTIPPQETARNEEDLRILETNTLRNNGVIIRHCDHSDHGLRRLGRWTRLGWRRVASPAQERADYSSGETYRRPREKDSNIEGNGGADYSE